MKKGIEVFVLGDFGPFSRTGKSIGYQVKIAGNCFLVDCGAPLFNLIGPDELSEIDGLIVTHCHDDHKRWFTDLALYYFYSSHIQKKLTLLSIDEVKEELLKSAKPAMDRSLSKNSERMVDLAFEDYVEYRPIGPRANYRIVSNNPDGSRGRLRVVGPDGEALGPDMAKIVLSKKGGRARILFKDPELREWIEPETFYSFSSDIFYTKDKRYIEGDGYIIKSHKAPVWHGISGTALKFQTETDTLLFTSDTVHDLELWERLAGQKHEQNLGEMTRDEFEASKLIHGDINNFVERIWSPQRLEEAKSVFAGAAVFQDISLCGSTVHTDYSRIQHTVLDKGSTVLTHSPDNITSEWPLCFTDKRYRIKGDRFYEVVNEQSFAVKGDIFHKEKGTLYVGFRNYRGKYSVYDNEGVLSVDMYGKQPLGKLKFKVDLYQDVMGQLFPVLEGKDEYRIRADGKIERVHYTAEGSHGHVVECIRDQLARVEKGFV